MKNHGIITVKEWMLDKIDAEAHRYGMTLVMEYDENDMADHTKLRVEEVLAETEKAYKVAVDAETFGGSVRRWNTWLPKSTIIEG